MPSKPRRKPISEDFNIVFRFSGISESADTIEEHYKVIKTEGSVWLGIAGTGFSTATIQKLNSSPENGKARYLYLAKLVTNNYQAYKAEILGCSVEVPKNPKLIPRYYNEFHLINAVKVWLHLRCLQSVSSAEFASLMVASTGTNLEEALRRGAKTILFVNALSES